MGIVDEHVHRSPSVPSTNHQEARIPAPHLQHHTCRETTEPNLRTIARAFPHRRVHLTDSLFLKREVSQGLRVQFATRSEWIGLLVGKAGARIRDIRNATGCSVEVIDGRGGGGQRGDFGQGDCDGAVGAAATDGGAYGSGGHARAALPCRVVISGPTADSVQEAREQMELVEVSIPIDPKQVPLYFLAPGFALRVHAAGWCNYPLNV